MEYDREQAKRAIRNRIREKNRKRRAAAKEPPIAEPGGFNLLSAIGNRNMQQLGKGMELLMKLAAAAENTGSIHELEADRTAERVMRESTAQPDREQKRRAYPATNKPGKKNTRQHPAVPGLGPGKPLTEEERTGFEERMGADFSCVRVHTGPTAEQFARAVKARAFTYRNNIVFGQGEYAPGTREGKKLMAHELAHVMQGGEEARCKERFRSQYTADLHPEQAYVEEKMLDEDFGTIQVTGELSYKWISPKRLMELYHDISEIVRINIESIEETIQHYHNRYYYTLKTIKAKALSKTNYYTKVVERNSDTKGNSDMDVTVIYWGGSHRHITDEIEYMKYLIGQYNKNIFTVFQHNNEDIRDFYRNANRQFNEARLEFEKAREQVKVIAHKMFTGAVDISDDKKAKAVREALFDIWKESVDMTETMQGIAISGDTGLFKNDPRGHARAKLFQRINRINAYFDLFKNWKSDKSGIKLRNDIASMQNFMSVAKKAPGPHSLMLSQYITPLVSKAGTVLGEIAGHYSNFNETLWNSTGRIADYNLLPGGKAVFDFMLAFWEPDYEPLKKSIDNKVVTYFEPRLNQLADFLQEKPPSPGESPVDFKYYVYNHREKIWVLLYGTMKTPDKVVRRY